MTPKKPTKSQTGQLTTLLAEPRLTHARVELLTSGELYVELYRRPDVPVALPPREGHQRAPYAIVALNRRGRPAREARVNDAAGGWTVIGPILIAEKLRRSLASVEAIREVVRDG